MDRPVWHVGYRLHRISAGDPHRCGRDGGRSYQDAGPQVPHTLLHREVPKVHCPLLLLCPVAGAPAIRFRMTEDSRCPVHSLEYKGG